jgi:parvulin-like peptidyl-prolyl isomerase
MSRKFPRFAAPLFVLGATLLALPLFAETGPAPLSAVADPGAVAADPGPASEADPVVVTVDGAAIRESELLADLDERVNIYAAESAKKGLIYDESSRPQTRDFYREQALNTLLVRRLTASRLAADGIEITEAEVDAAFEAKLRERGQTRAEAEAEIAEQGKSMAGVRTRIRWNNLAVRKLYERHATPRKTVTEEEARLIYLASPEEYLQEHERRVSRILIIATPEHDAGFRAAARVRAEAILARLRSGVDFAALAREHSEDDYTRAKGGDRGWSKRGFVTAPGNDPFGDAAFAIKKVGDISDVVETIDGYEIILLTGLREERQKPFEEVKAEIIAKKEYNHIGVFWDAFAAGLKKQADIRWSPAELARREEKARRDREFLASQKTGDAASSVGGAGPAAPENFVRLRPADNTRTGATP